MITLSLCMIVRNERETLPRALESVRGIFDEIIIADTGSNDGTVKAAAAFTDKIYRFEWRDDFSAARNFSFSRATKDFIMWLDADDVLHKKDAAALARLKRTLSPDTDVVMMKYDTGFDADGKVTFSYYRERILRRAANFKWQDPVHEVITPAGKIIYSDIAVTHMEKKKKTFSARNLTIYEKLREKGATFTPRLRFYYARELMYSGEYERAAAEFETLFGEGGAWKENLISACLNMSECLLNLGRKDEAFTALLNSMRYDAPRAETACALGNFFLAERRLNEAVFWYKLAATLDPEENKNNFTSADCYAYIPYMQLCVCYDLMGDRETAVKYNKKAGKVKRFKDPAYLYNKKYFEKTMKKTSENGLKINR